MKNSTGLKFRSFFFLILILGVFNLNTRSQNWQAMGTGTGGTVNAVTVFGNEIIAAGYFAVAGGQLVNNIARWNGAGWQPLGLGTNDTIFALTVFNNMLVAGGRFTSAGGVNCNKVALWNGSSWSSTGGIFNGNVFALAVNGSYLAVGGNFTTVNGRAMLKVAKYQSAWDTLGTGFNGDVYTLALYNTGLYAGGNFTISDGLPVKRIARLVVNNWTTVGVGIDDGTVYCMRVFNNSLHIGGTFTTIGGSTTNRIAKWNGSSWANVGFGFSGGVYALHSLGTNLYAGGEFDFADFLPAAKIAVFNGSSWSALGTGIGGSSPKVKGISSYLGDLVTGGTFTLAGGVSANNIALWKLTTGVIQINNNIPVNYSLQQNYPNPFNPATKIKFSLPKEGFVSLGIYDSKGTLISELIGSQLAAGNYETELNAINLSSGIYFYKLVTNDFSDTKKMILVK